MKTRFFLTAMMMIANFLFADLIQEVSFDTTDVNNSIEQVITLSNTGDLPLAIYKLALHSDNDSFTLMADSNYTIEGGDQVDITVTFSPVHAGDHSATLYLESNDEENSEVTLNLNGFARSTTAIDDFNNLPTEFGLNQNYPNPFNPSTTVKYQLPKSSKVSLTVYNITGQKVATLVNDVQSAGYHQIMWTGTNQLGQKVSSGVYFLRMQTESFAKTISMTFTK